MDDHILQQLPHHLRREMLQVMGIPVVRSTPIFKNTRHSILEEIVGRMEPRLFLADQVWQGIMTHLIKRLCLY